MQLTDWLATVPETDPVDPAQLAALGELLEVAATDAVEIVTRATGRAPEPGGLRVPKSRLAAIERCERSATAAAASPDPSTQGGDAVLRGVALDRFVIHQLRAGRVREPVADLRSMLAAEGEWELLDVIDRRCDAGDASLGELLDPLAATVAAAWGDIGPEWAPRTQSRASLALADARVVCSGIVDVHLGGPGTGRPGIVVEVKSGGPLGVHLSELALYGLLVTLRDGVAPSHVGRWYPGSAPSATPVTEGLLESAARRVADGVRTWAELVAGRTPGERPGAWCAWCPAASRCPSSAGPATDPEQPEVRVPA